MFIVLEIQKNADGQIGTLVYSYNNEAEAYHGYFTIAAACAISTVPLHSVVLMTEIGSMIRNESFLHQTDTVATEEIVEGNTTE